ncbi:potassium channel family protein [Sungkyunkwania multivorans]|uniref:Potassium channel family protein n=1 Tax=Sungkyunkwania multivorans TaxID=1173618 RepID=A0ABW3CY10_9FLAO
MFKLFRSKFYIALALLTLVFLMGVIGYVVIGNYSLVDAAYMTIITVTTVGYKEVHPSDVPTKIFTIILIITSVFVFAYSVTVITEYILGKNTSEQLKTKKRMKKISELNDHIIICGYGRNGKQAAEKLKIYQRPFLVIEKDRDIIERFEEHILFVEGNANEDEVLENARIDKANTLITALPNDADNLFIVLTARQMNPKIRIISRASEETSVRKLKLAGANNVIMPDKTGGDHMASLVVVPDLVEFLDSLSLEEDNSANLEEVAIEDLSKDYVNKSLYELDIRKKTGCTVIGYKSADGKYMVNPETDLPLAAKSKLIVLGRPEQIQKLNRLFNI